MKMKNSIFLLIGCAILIVMIWKIGATNIYQEFLKADPYLLIGAFFMTLLALFIKAYRWSKLFVYTKEIDAWKIYIIGMAVNQTMPTGSGELTRAYIAKSKLNISISDTLVPVVIERLADTTFMIALSVAYLTFLTTGNGYILQLTIPLIILFSGYSLLLRPDFVDKFVLILERFPRKNSFINKSINRISQSLKTFKEAIVRFDNKRKIIWQIIMLTVISWCIYGSGMYMLLLAFGHKIPIFNVLAITAVSEIVGTFSFLPGGLGTKELSFAVLLTTFEIPMAIGISVLLMARMMGYIQLGTGAFISLTSFAKTYQIDEINKNEVL